MSVVTNIILCCSLRDQKFVDQLSLDFNDIGAHFGGPKHCEAGVYGCAANYLDEDEFRVELAFVPWEYPERVRVFMQRQEEDFFTQVYYDTEEPSE